MNGVYNYGVARAPHMHDNQEGALKLENTPPYVPSTVVVSSSQESEQLPTEKVEVIQENTVHNEQQAQDCLKSSLRKVNCEPKEYRNKKKKKKKKRVQWMDLAGKELVEIREFESSEMEDVDKSKRNTSSCIIL